MADNRRQSGVPWVGMRRVDFVRIALSDDSVTAEAVGVSNRLPAARPIPLSTALSLADAGIPAVVRDRRADRGQFRQA
ncbi:MAG TPA: hypothetical protein VGR20_21230 [Acidimicrobiia bacterium]|nr:hypothetical protein [Acidimicrobiia bacterium]